jgi:hypothetical protein
MWETIFLQGGRLASGDRFVGIGQGKMVYFAACWENIRDEKGPWSDVVSVVIL